MGEAGRKSGGCWLGVKHPVLGWWQPFKAIHSINMDSLPPTPPPLPNQSLNINTNPPTPPPTLSCGWLQFAGAVAYAAVNELVLQPQEYKVPGGGGAGCC